MLAHREVAERISQLPPEKRQTATLCALALYGATFEDQKKVVAERAFRKLVDKGKSPEEARAALITLGVDEDDLPPV